MQTIGLIKQKGGAGATTIAVHLALAARDAGRRPLIVDIDPQGSATAWAAMRAAALGEGTEPPVVAIDAGQIPAVLDAAAADGYDLAVIDTPPHNSAAMAAVARASDFCLLPTKAGPFDLAALRQAVEIVAATKRPASIILNMIPATGSEGEDAREAVGALGLPVWVGQLGDRRAFRRTVSDGRTVIDPLDAKERAAARTAAVEIRALWEHVAAALDHTPNRARAGATR